MNRGLYNIYFYKCLSNKYIHVVVPPSISLCVALHSFFLIITTTVTTSIMLNSMTPSEEVIPAAIETEIE